MGPVGDKVTLSLSLPLALVSSPPGKGLAWLFGSNLPCPGCHGDLILLGSLWSACLGEEREIRMPSLF